MCRRHPEDEVRPFHHLLGEVTCPMGREVVAQLARNDDRVLRRLVARIGAEPGALDVDAAVPPCHGLGERAPTRVAGADEEDAHARPAASRTASKIFA